MLEPATEGQYITSVPQNRLRIVANVDLQLPLQRRDTIFTPALYRVTRSSTMAAQVTPPLLNIPVESLTKLSTTPSQKIRLDEDLDVWRTTTAYHDYSIFLRRLNESVVGYFLPWSSHTPSQVRTRSKCLHEAAD